MTFRDWQDLDPAAAARELHERVRTRLSVAQQRAVIAQLTPEPELAERLHASRAARRPLAGVPYLVKDLFDVAGVPTFAGSSFLPEVRETPTKDGAFVQAMTNTGAVVAGKTHLHEFAYGITGENRTYGDCEHPRFPGRTTGGSSSGSAAAVAAGIVPLALGSDTGGSIRVPAAFCGLFGFRFSPGEPWIRDAVPLAPTFDTAGWFTANVADMRLVVGAAIGLRTEEREPRGCYLEMPGMDAEVAEACRAAAARFSPTADITTTDTLHQGFALALEAYHTTVAVEAWEAHRKWAEKYRDRYDPIVWQRLIRVKDLSREQIAAAAVTRRAINVLWRSYFDTYEFLVLPASPTPALTKAECTAENRNRVLTLTAAVSIGGYPVLTIPVPLAGGLTTGLQIVVRRAAGPEVNWALGRCN